MEKEKNILCAQTEDDLRKNAMLADASLEDGERIFSPAVMEDWQRRMHSASIWGEGRERLPPAYGVITEPMELRPDIPQNHTAADSCISLSAHRCTGRADMSQGTYILVPKVVSE